MTVVTCDRCGTASPPNLRGVGGAIAQGWSKFEALKEDGETLYHVTVCPDCLTDAEEADASPISQPAEAGSTRRERTRWMRRVTPQLQGRSPADPPCVPR